MVSLGPYSTYHGQNQWDDGYRLVAGLRYTVIEYILESNIRVNMPRVPIA